MATNVDAFRVFIASPGGLEIERTAIREEIDEFNRQLMHDSGAAFTAEGWESVPGGRRRAQELINEQIEPCDYMILILWERWGTAPDTDGQFSSGTEEEFALAQRLIDDAEYPMADILILFKGVPERQLSDPGEQLRQVLNFKKELEDSKQWMYKTFDDIAGLRREISSRLLAWARLTGGHATPVDGEPTTQPPKLNRELAVFGDLTDREVSNDGESEAEGVAQVSSGDPSDVSSLLRVAESYAERGLVTQAENAYAKAVADSNIEALESYGKFLRQVGRTAKSLEINRLALASLSDGNDTVLQRARILTNIGIIQRKDGQLRESRSSLLEAIRTLGEPVPANHAALAYALDNVGITAMRAGDTAEAMQSYERALAIRTTASDMEGAARTLINIARLLSRRGELERALETCSRAIEVLTSSRDQSSLAGAVSALGEIHELMGNFEAAENSYRSALHINEGLGRHGNIALSMTQIASLLIRIGRLDEAARYAEGSLAENELASNHEGVTASRHLLGRIYASTDDSSRAIGLLEEAVAGYAAIGNPTGEGWARYHLSDVLRRIGLDVEAAEYLKSAQSLALRVENEELSRAVSD